MFGVFELLLQDDQLRLLFEGRWVSEGFQRFMQLCPTHRHIDLRLFQRGIGSGGFLCADSLEGSLYRVDCRFARLRGTLPGLAFGDFLLLFALQARIALFKAAPRVIALEGSGLLRLRCEGQPPDNRQYRVQRQRTHFDAVHRARCYAEVATGAFINDHRVHQFGRPDDGIDRAGLNALGATDTLGFADIGNLRRCRAASDVQFQHRYLQ
ncbi:hypothetical protein D3C81_1452120 [compost metagenome]